MEHLLRHIFRALLFFLAIISAASVYFWQQEGLRYYSIRSASMQPTLRIGDLVIDEKLPVASIKKGDIITYQSPADSSILITHRVIKVDSQNSLVTTRGDKLITPDTPIPYSAILGRDVKSIPAAGYLLDSLRNPLGLIALIYLPVLALSAVEIKKLTRHHRRPYKHAKFS